MVATTVGPRLVLIHSLGMDRFFWERVIPIVADDAAILAYDCRGHGASDSPRAPTGSRIRRRPCRADGSPRLALGDRRRRLDGRLHHAGLRARHAARATALGLIDTTAWYNAADKWEERATTATSAGLAAMIDFQVTAGSPMAFGRLTPTW